LISFNIIISAHFLITFLSSSDCNDKLISAARQETRILNDNSKTENTVDVVKEVELESNKQKEDEEGGLVNCRK
jgi:hypothetical protein